MRVPMSNGRTEAKRAKLTAAANVARACKIEEVTIEKHSSADKNRQCNDAASETGCGKSTQIPQILLEQQINEPSTSHSECGTMIVCTQPRRVAAVSLAKRVADEMGEVRGKTVAYSVRFDSTCTEATKILYATDGILLREAMHDSLLRRFTIIIIDEAHERSLHTDVLLSVVKKAQRQRRRQKPKLPHLRIIIMSATIHAELFQFYLRRREDDEVPLLYIEGRVYPITLKYLPNDDADYVEKTLVSIFQLHRELPPNEHFLVFLTGEEEIEMVCGKVRQIAKSLDQGEPKIDVRTLYSAMSVDAQMRAFELVKQANVRKIVLATNIAETSVTIPGIRHVIDCGRVKQKLFDSERDIDLLQVVPISKAQANQRAGRAGREGPGNCYRLYTEADYEQRDETQKSEMERCALTEVVLELLSLSVGDVYNFDYLTPPSKHSIKAALSELKMLGAVCPDPSTPPKSEQCYSRTRIGRRLSELPVEPRLGKCLLAAAEAGVLDSMLSIVSMLSVERIFVNRVNTDASAVEEAQARFVDISGDHMTLLNVYNAFHHQSRHAKYDGDVVQFCRKYYLNYKALKQAVNIRRQLNDVMKRFDIKGVPTVSDIKSEAHSEAVRRSLCAGLFMKCAVLDRNASVGTVYRIISCAEEASAPILAKIHPSSALAGKRPATVVFTSLVHTTQAYMREVSIVSNLWLKAYLPSAIVNRLK